jgi:hemerythrin-like domain-containing protein
VDTGSGQAGPAGVSARTPTRELTDEHLLVSRVIAAMQREAAHVRGAGSVHGDLVAEMLDFTRRFTDDCHHGKEERSLFPALRERSEQSGSLIAAMLLEHEGARRRIATLSDALPAARTGDAAALAAVADSLDNYVSLLTSHIAKEHHILFPMVDRLFTEDDQQRVAAEFARIEIAETGAGTHERYSALAEKIATAEEIATANE